MLLDYESDAKLAQSQGKPVYYLIPKATLQIETPLAAVNGSNKAAAQQFVNWLYTPAAQTIWAQNGYRSVLPASRRSTCRASRPARSCSRSATSAAGTR